MTDHGVGAFLKAISGYICPLVEDDYVPVHCMHLIVRASHEVSHSNPSSCVLSVKRIVIFYSCNLHYLHVIIGLLSGIFFEPVLGR